MTQPEERAEWRIQVGLDNDVMIQGGLHGRNPAF